MKYTILYSILCISLVSSCGNYQQESAEMEKIQKILSEKYKWEPVGISITRDEGETLLTMTLENSPVSDSSESYKQALADSIGRICVTNLRSVKLSGGELVFAEHHLYVVVNTSRKTSYDMHIGPQPKTEAD